MFLVIWLGLCVLVAAVASQQGRSGLGFFFLSLIFSPLIGFIVLACVGRARPEQQTQVIQVVQTVYVDRDGRPLTDQRVIEYSGPKLVPPSNWRAIDDAERKREWERQFLGKD